MIILAIESAISGGSVSLLDESREIAHWIGTSNVSRAEDLIVNVDELLNSNKIERNEIDLIAVSAGPGSFTGIRIGIATALGLKAGLGIEMSSESALKAMAFSQPDNDKIVAVIPMGRDSVCLQSFQKQSNIVTPLDEPRTMPEEAFLSTVLNETNATFALHSALYEKERHEKSVINFGCNVAYAIGIMCRLNAGQVIEPLFISKSF